MTALYHAPDGGCGDCPFYGDEFDVCQAVKREGEPDGRPTGSVAATSPDNPSPPAPEWCPLRVDGWVTVRPPLVRTYDWQEIHRKAHERAPLRLIEHDGTETEAKWIGGNRYQLPDGRVLRVSAGAGSIAVWEEP